MTLTTSYRKRIFREFSAIFRFSLRKIRGTLFLYGFLQTILLPLLLLLNIEAKRNSSLSSPVPSTAFSDALRVLFPLTAVPLMLIFSVVFILQLFRRFGTPCQIHRNNSLVHTLRFNYCKDSDDTFNSA